MKKNAILLVLLTTLTTSVSSATCHFIERDYLALNQDVLAALFRGDFSSGYEHYKSSGHNEGRAYNQFCGPVAQAPYCPFVEHEYLDFNPDVKAAVENGYLNSGHEHFANSGYKENRILSNICYKNTYGTDPGLVCQFSEKDYLALNQDVQAAVFRGEFSSGRQHYNSSGLSEGRAYNQFCGPTAQAVYCPFVEQEYLDFNPDVKQAVNQGLISSGREHFANSGYKENRLLSEECYHYTYQ